MAFWVQVHAQAKAALRAGMEMLSQAEVGAALQIYFNLDALPQARLPPLRTSDAPLNSQRVSQAEVAAT